MGYVKNGTMSMASEHGISRAVVFIIISFVACLAQAKEWHQDYAVVGGGVDTNPTTSRADPLPLLAIALGCGLCLFIIFFLGILCGVGWEREKRNQDIGNLERQLQRRDDRLQRMLVQLRELEQQVQHILSTPEKPHAQLRLDVQGNLQEIKDETAF